MQQLFNSQTSYHHNTHNAISMGALTLFLCNEMVPSGGYGRQWHPKCVAYVQSTRFLVFVCFVTAEKPSSHRYDVRNDNRVFSAVMAISGCSAATLILNTGRVTSKVVCDLQQLIFFLHRYAGFTWMVDKWVTDPFLGGLWVIFGREVALELFWKQRQVIVHQLGEWRLSLAQNPR